jgi:hypothetical protein
MRAIMYPVLACVAIGSVACGGTAEDLEFGRTGVALREREKTIMKVNREGVFASFLRLDGCIQTGANLIANREATRTVPNPVMEGGLIAIETSVVDVCTSEVIRNGMAIVEDPMAFTIKNNLSKASLDAVIEGLDVGTGEALTYNVSLDWTATGPKSKLKERNKDTSMPDFVIKTRTKDVSRTAVAMGAISDGTFDYSLDPSNDGLIQETSQGTITITHFTRN